MFASKSTKENLEKIKIFYDENPTQMRHFLETVKSWTIITPDIEKIMNTFRDITKEQLEKFSIDLYDLTKTKNNAKQYHTVKSKEMEIMEHIKSLTRAIHAFSRDAVKKRPYNSDPTLMR
jgi:hypothetical protein